MKHFVLMCFAMLAVLPLFGQTLIPSQNESGLYGFVDSGGKTVIDPIYDDVNFGFYEGVACVVKGDRYVLIDTSGKEISREYAWVGPYDSHNLCKVNLGGKTDDFGNLLGGKYGFVNLYGDEVIPLKYALIGDFNEFDVALINEGGAIDKNGDFTAGKFGFINSSGEILVSPKYSFVGEFDDDGLAWVNVGGKLNEFGECSGGKYGYVDCNGMEIVAPIYSNIGRFDSDGFCWVNNGGRVYNYDQNTESKISSRLKALTSDEDDRNKILAVREEIEDELLGTKRDVFGNRVYGGKFGFVDKSGKEVVSVTYTNISDGFTDGLAWAATKKYGVIDANGREVVKFSYDRVGDFHNGVAVVMVRDKKKGDLYGLIDNSGKELTQIEYSEIGGMENGFTYVAKPSDDGKSSKQKVSFSQALMMGNPSPEDSKNSSQTSEQLYGFIDNGGKLLTDLKYNGVGEISEGVAVCWISDKFGYVDSSGREIVPFGLLEANPFVNGVAWVKLNRYDSTSNQKGSNVTLSGAQSDIGKYGLINKNGVALTDFVFDEVGTLSDGLFYVQIDDQGGGWINSEGEYVIPIQYSGVGSFYNGLAAAKLSGLWGLIDKSNNVVVEFKYDDISNIFNAGLYGVKSGSHWGGIDVAGNVVIPFDFGTFDEVEEISDAVYVPQGFIPLTERDVEKYMIRKKNLEKHFDINNKIPDEYWDY